MQPSLFDHQEPAAAPPAATPDKGTVTLPGHVEPQGNEACATDTGPGATETPRLEGKGLLHGGTGLSRGIADQHTCNHTTCTPLGEGMYQCDACRAMIAGNPAERKGPWHPKPSAEAAAILKIARMSSIRAQE